MKRFFYTLGLLIFFGAGAGSVLLVDLARQRLGSETEQTQAAVAPEPEGRKVVPLIPEDEIWEVPAASEKRGKRRRAGARPNRILRRCGQSGRASGSECLHLARGPTPRDAFAFL